MRNPIKRGVVTPQFLAATNESFKRGAAAAASVAAAYATTHPYRVDDCILAKLNLRRGKPRRNPRKLPDPYDTWMLGAATALAEMHRLLLGGGDSAGVRRVASTCGITIAQARKAGLATYDLRELKKAGVA